MLQYTGTPCPHTVTGFCRCFAFRIGKIRGHNSIIRNFQFRKFLPMKSNYEVTVHLPSLSEIITICKMRQQIISLPHPSYFIFQAISFLSHDLFSSIHRSPDPHTFRRSPVSPPRHNADQRLCSALAEEKSSVISECLINSLSCCLHIRVI